MTTPDAAERLTLAEYGWAPDFVGVLAGRLGTGAAQAVAALHELDERLVELLGVEEGLIDIRGRDVRVRDCAGILRVAPGVEVEVVPKFLTADTRWHEDFLLFATLAENGRLLPSEALSSGVGERGDLATFIAQTMLGMFWPHQRRPLRQYRRRVWHEFSLDGEFDPESLLLPTEDGFRLEGSFFERTNGYNATIWAAFRALLPEVADPEVSAQMRRAISALSPQDLRAVDPRPRLLPSRHRHWQPLFDLAGQVLRGYGVGYSGAAFEAPGFVLQTWRTWQSVVLAALRQGLPEHLVDDQASFQLGLRNGRALNVKPDISVMPSASAALLLDAKYKTRIDRSIRIVEADVYESLAFMRAAGTDTLLLLYPRQEGGPVRSAGECEIFETILVADQTILGVAVECRGVSGQGFDAFAQRLAEFVQRRLAATTQGAGTSELELASS